MLYFLQKQLYSQSAQIKLFVWQLYLENTCGKFSMPKFATITCFVPQEQSLCSRSVTSALPNYSLQGCASEDLKKGESNTCAQP